METWRGASTPGAAKIRHASTACPFGKSGKSPGPRATVGRSYAPAVPASCPPGPERSHPGPGEGNGIRTATRSRNNGAPVAVTRGAERSDAAAVHPYRVHPLPGVIDGLT